MDPQVNDVTPEIPKDTLEKCACYRSCTAEQRPKFNIWKQSCACTATTDLEALLDRQEADQAILGGFPLLKLAAQLLPEDVQAETPEPPRDSKPLS